MNEFLKLIQREGKSYKSYVEASAASGLETGSPGISYETIRKAFKGILPGEESLVQFAKIYDIDLDRLQLAWLRTKFPGLNVSMGKITIPTEISLPSIGNIDREIIPRKNLSTIRYSLDIFNDIIKFRKNKDNIFVATVSSPFNSIFKSNDILIFEKFADIRTLKNNDIVLIESGIKFEIKRYLLVNYDNKQKAVYQKLVEYEEELHASSKEKLYAVLLGVFRPF